MDQDQNQPVEAFESDLAKKIRKAEIKAMDKARKSAKSEKKLAKQAEKSAKDSQKALRKLAKQQRKDTGLSTPVEAVAVPLPTEKKEKPLKPKAAGLISISLGAKLQSVARLARSHLAASLLEYGLYAGQEQVLFLLDDHGPMALAELAVKLDVRAPTITKTVTRMEAQGFLSRTVSPDDARSVIIALTQEGTRVLKIGRKIVVDVEKKTFSVLSKTDCESLKIQLDLVLSQLKQQ